MSGQPRAMLLSMTVTTEIDMQVRLGFVTAFRFRHISEERWANGSLTAIDSRTEDNGDAYTVRGERSLAGLRSGRARSAEAPKRPIC